MTIRGEIERISLLLSRTGAVGIACDVRQSPRGDELT